MIERLSSVCVFSFLRGAFIGETSNKGETRKSRGTMVLPHLMQHIVTE